ncbi:response regulator transcription factor [Streptomyces sp. NPDC052396]|uniref:response regulator transcription factor n=1 Tax=Streptomyces sp. NPDC052396 TaxID=3365689 RepID=UPI0037D7A708
MGHQSTGFLEQKILRQSPTRPRLPAQARSTLRVLVVENEPRAARALVMGLRRHGYQADSVDTGTKALQQYRDADLLLIDLDLPDLDGVAVCRAIRSAGNTAIIVVTARDTELDRVLSLQAGSDDYIVKPYGFPELTARIEAVMRRVRPVQQHQPVTEIIIRGPLSIDSRTREIHLGDRRVEVTRKEFDLLYLLASQPENIISRKQIMTQVWEDSRSRPGRTIDTHVSSLRSKLGSSTWIITARGVGFRFGHA